MCEVRWLGVRRGRRGKGRGSVVEVEIKPFILPVFSGRPFPLVPGFSTGPDSSPSTSTDPQTHVLEVRRT